MLAVLLLSATLVFSQDPAPAVRGATYGEGATAEGAIPVDALASKASKDTFQGKVTGKIVEVCEKKGCWMKMQQQDGQTVMIKFKDYGFFMPKDIVGKEVVVDGDAYVKEVSVKQLQHYAKDAGKPDAEVKKIKEPKREMQILAKGVLVL